MLPERFKRWWATVRVSSYERVDFYRWIAMDDKHGVGVRDCLKDIYNERVELRGVNNALAIMVKGCLDASERGEELPLVVGLSGYASDSELMLLAAGEQSGQLSENLELAAKEIEMKRDFNHEVRSVLAQPLSLLVLTLLAIVFVGAVFIPDIIANAGDQLNANIRILKWISDVMTSGIGVLLGVLLLSIIVLIIYSFENWTGKYRKIADRFPPWSIYRLVVGSGWLYSVASMLRAGISMGVIITDMLKRTDNLWLEERLRSIWKEVDRGGENLGDALKQSGMEFPSRSLIESLKRYTKHNTDNTDLVAIAQDWVNRNVRQIKDSCKVLKLITEAIVFILIGGFIYLVVSMFNINTF